MAALGAAPAGRTVALVASSALDQTTSTLPAAAQRTSDAVLLVAITAGQLGALADLYDRHRVVAYSLAFRITRDAALAEDAVQEAFLGAWRNEAGHAEDRASVKTWLLAIVRHRAVDLLRRRRPTVELPEPDAASPITLQGPDIWPEVAARLDAEPIQSALASLSDAQRRAIELSFFRGLTHQEIATHTRTPLGTVKSRVRLGLLALRRTIEAMPSAVGGGSR